MRNISWSNEEIISEIRTQAAGITGAEVLSVLACVLVWSLTKPVPVAVAECLKKRGLG